MRYNTFSQHTQHSFKKRYALMKPEFEFKQASFIKNLYLLKPSVFEYSYLKRLKKIVKRLIRRRVLTKKKVHKNWLKRKAWMSLRPNFPISRKSKNSRMGKGVGSFVRWSIRLRRYFIL